MFTFDHGLKAFFLSFRIYDEELTAYCGFYALRCSLNYTKFEFNPSMLMSLGLPSKLSTEYGVFPRTIHSGVW